MTSEAYGERAEALFRSGYNCAMSVLCAFSDHIGADEQILAALACPFGGGFAGTRGLCGAVAGAAAAYSVQAGGEKEENKKEIYAVIAALKAEFEAMFGSATCEVLLTGCPHGPTPMERSAEYYKQRPCAKLVREAAILTARRLTARGLL